MAISFDAETSDAFANVAPSTSRFMTIGNSSVDGLLLVWTFLITAGAFDSVTVRNNSTFLTFLLGVDYIDQFGNYIDVELWGIVAPTTGTDNIELGLVGGPNAGLYAANAVTYNGVDQVTPIGASTFAASNGGVLTPSYSPNITIGTNGSWAVAGIENHTVVQTATSGCYFRSGAGGGSGIFDSNGPESPGTATFVVSGTGASVDWSALMVEIKPSGAAPTSGSSQLAALGVG